MNERFRILLLLRLPSAFIWREKNEMYNCPFSLVHSFRCSPVIDGVVTGIQLALPATIAGRVQLLSVVDAQ